MLTAPAVQFKLERTSEGPPVQTSAQSRYSWVGLFCVFSVGVLNISEGKDPTTPQTILVTLEKRSSGET